MKPIAIFRHSEAEGPGYFATFLEAHSLAWQLIAIDQQQAVPSDAGEFAGICLMGGPMSVNDPLPWIGELCALIRDAVRLDVPLLGHCLGGQLISRALGGQITRNPVKEIGWGEVRASDAPLARHWLGELFQDNGTGKHGVEVFHWHGETFSIPPGAQRLLGNDCCANQAFALGPHLALQCHVEMSAEMIATWCASWSTEIAGIDPLPPSVQTPQQMLARSGERIVAMRRLADQLYSTWIAALKRD